MSANAQATASATDAAVPAVRLCHWLADGSSASYKELAESVARDRGLQGQWCTCKSAPDYNEVHELADLYKGVPGDMYLETAEKCNRVENRGAIADRHPAGDIRSYYCPVHAMLNSARMCRGYKLEGSQDRERNPGCVGMIVPCGPCWDGVCISCAQGPWEPIGVPCPVSTRSPRPPPATEAEAAERAWRPSSPASRLRPAVALPELPAPAPVPRELLAHDEVVADKRARDEDSEDEERDRPAKKKKPSTRKRVVAREDEHPGLRRSARTKGRK